MQIIQRLRSNSGPALAKLQQFLAEQKHGMGLN
jgi:hypothetical protein